MKPYFILILLILPAYPQVHALESTKKEQYRQRFLAEMSEIYNATLNSAGGLSLHGSHHETDEQHNSQEKQPEKMTQPQVVALSKRITRCHMDVMALYPEALQQVAYQAVAQGQDIEQARRAFVQAIDRQKQASPQQQEKMDALQRRFIKQANQCISEAMEGTPLPAHHNH